MSDQITPLVHVTGVRVLSRYILEFTFEDGAVKVIDVEPYLWGEMFEPLTEDYGLFLGVAVDERAGTVVWPNGADLSSRMLYPESKVATPARRSGSFPQRG
ncbi:MAG TPA: DUF2442 domain-containing protein [Nitriliruptorales bacterium]